MKSSATERKASIRRDVNDLVRDDRGRVSPARIGLLVGQWLAIKLILENGAAIIANWDSLLVLFLVLTAPDVLRKIASMKYNGNSMEHSHEPRQRKKFSSGRKGQDEEFVRDLSRE